MKGRREVYERMTEVNALCCFWPFQYRDHNHLEATPYLHPAYSLWSPGRLVEVVLRVVVVVLGLVVLGAAVVVAMGGGGVS